MGSFLSIAKINYHDRSSVVSPYAYVITSQQHLDAYSDTIYLMAAEYKADPIGCQPSISRIADRTAENISRGVADNFGDAVDMACSAIITVTQRIFELNGYVIIDRTGYRIPTNIIKDILWVSDLPPDILTPDFDDKKYIIPKKWLVKIDNEAGQYHIVEADDYKYADMQASDLAMLDCESQVRDSYDYEIELFNPIKHIKYL